MVDYIELENKLLKEIEEEKGFSWKKFVKIVELNGLLNGVK